jgi:hypothetical protein
MENEGREELETQLPNVMDVGANNIHDRTSLRFQRYREMPSWLQ